MNKLERIISRGIFGVAALFATAIFLFLYEIEFNITWIHIVFAFLFGWPSILVFLIAQLFLN